MSKSSAKKQSEKSQQSELGIINRNAAGIDLGPRKHWVCVPPSATESNILSFGCTTPDLIALADWLSECGVTTVAMESTGVKWIPLFQILSARDFQVFLVNSKTVKTVPGRKSDVLDCEWLQQLHSYGLLAPSFVPEGEIAVLRSYLRQRENLIQNSSTHIQRIQKALTQMNLQLDTVIGDITGVTGLNIIRAIVSGETNPQILANLADKRIQSRTEQISKALTGGNYREEMVFILHQELSLYESYQQKILSLDKQIEECLSKFPSRSTEPPPKYHNKKRRRFNISSLIFYWKSGKIANALVKIVILLLQFFSLSTTVNGANILFKQVNLNLSFFNFFTIGTILGISIQTFLAICILSNETVKTKNSSFFLIIIALSVFSIYTNFFSIYNGFVGGELDKDLVQAKAYQTLQELKRDIYTDYSLALGTAKKQLQTALCKRYNNDPIGELPEGCQKGNLQPGKGPEFREANRQAEEAQTKKDELEPYVERQKDWFSDESIDKLKDATADDIFEHAQKALANLPHDIKEDAEKKGRNLEKYNLRETFMTPENRISPFIVPFYDIFSKKNSINAIAALIIAAALDIISLVIGINEKRKNTKQLISDMTMFINILVRDTVRSVFDITVGSLIHFYSMIKDFWDQSISEPSKLKEIIKVNEKIKIIYYFRIQSKWKSFLIISLIQSIAKTKR